MYKDKKINKSKVNASLTVEASLVLPLFIFFFAVFLYFIQIFIIQENLQHAMTDTALGLARAAYLYSDFRDAKEAETFDTTLLDDDIRTDFQNIVNTVSDACMIKYAVKMRLNESKISQSCILGGYEGISFDGSEVLSDSDDIDLVAAYRVRIPIRFFGLFEQDMIQRVRVRGWNGHKVPALYKAADENSEENNKTVYITESGNVYHMDKNCSHIKLSVKIVNGIPTWQRNNSGGKYYPCEFCIKGGHSDTGTYYITSYGDRYHKRADCPGIKRTVKEVPLSQVKNMAPCKRCGGR